jgi:murein DD-endopeptidase MepM/ murein hydrolase activator NlpD
MPRRLLLFSLVCLLVVTASTTGKPARADRIQSLQAKIADAKVQESRLQSDIGSIESRIRTLERQVGGVSTQLDALQHDLDLQVLRLHRIRELYRFQTEQLDFFSHEYNVSVGRLNARLIEIYETQEEPSTLDVLMSASSLGDFLEQVDYVRHIGSQDAVISTTVLGAKNRWHTARAKTAVTKKKVETVTRTIAVRTAEVRAEKQRLLISEKGLAAVRGRKKTKLASVQESKAEYLHEVAGLQAASSRVTAQLQSTGSSSYDSSPSSSGLIWPVSGPVVSGFGMRWGRMHEGIDIGVGYGTPIHAAASGTVVFSGWMDGYGNFVIIDHGGGMATAYGHQSAIAVGGGQSVSQGQLIGYVGCTGHCFGPHLHFEVRINGSPVDPLGYL